MRRVYMARCPFCPIVIASDDIKGPWGNDVGLPLLDHIGLFHPEAVYTEKERWETHINKTRNN